MLRPCRKKQLKIRTKYKDKQNLELNLTTESSICLMLPVLSSKQADVAKTSNLVLQSNVEHSHYCFKIHIKTHLCVLTDQQRRPRDI